MLQRIAAGDATAVDECLDRYGGLVWSLARRHLRQHADAEDAVQEIFIEIWRNAARFDPNIASEATFITMIARRRLIDRQRKQSRRIAAHSMEEDVVASVPSEQSRIDSDDDAERARRYMGKLRVEEQRVLELALFQGMSQSQISETAGLPLGTVKTHARRGLIRLRQMLAADADPLAARGSP